MISSQGLQQMYSPTFGNPPGRSSPPPLKYHPTEGQWAAGHALGQPFPFSLPVMALRQEQVQLIQQKQPAPAPAPEAFHPLSPRSMAATSLHTIDEVSPPPRCEASDGQAPLPRTRQKCVALTDILLLPTSTCPWVNKGRGSCFTS